MIQMGIIRSSKYQALVARGPKVVNDKWKQKDESRVEKEQSNEPSGSKEARRMEKERPYVLTVEGAFIQKDPV